MKTILKVETDDKQTNLTISDDEFNVHGWLDFYTDKTEGFSVHITDLYFVIKQFYEKYKEEENNII
ncbi:MAG: hypothetical protein GWP19_03350 [Planctomycetia bacterium]|nr:hypothetical protein [Planctomycetia bacterium]